MSGGGATTSTSRGSTRGRTPLDEKLVANKEHARSSAGNATDRVAHIAGVPVEEILKRSRTDRRARRGPERVLDVRDARAITTFANEIDTAHGGVDIVLSKSLRTRDAHRGAAEARGRVRRHVASDRLRDQKPELAT